MSDERVNQSIREIEFLRSELIKAGETVKQIQEENARLKDALAYSIKHWEKCDSLFLHQEFRDKARKLIEP